jgi:chemotaxis protein MotB
VAEAGEIIIIKKKAAHNGHHGGAWKVAYADFVTAMMALFIVLWLMNTSKEVRDAVGGYFKDPRATSKFVGTSKQGANVIITTIKQQDLEKLKADLLKSIHHLDPLDKLKNQIEITITPEGLRIDLMESAKGTFFELGSAQPTPALVDILKLLAQQLGQLPNHISIEGHTDSTPYSGKRAYDNWDLSTDRANEARRIMQGEGIRQGQISQVRGFADQRLRLPQKPTDPSNRRISMIVQYQILDEGEVAPKIDPAHMQVTTGQL